MLIHHPHVRRTALRLMRACGDRALIEARQWARHFAEAGESAERRVWLLVCLELREHRSQALARAA
jgi:hypothetical protein